MKRLILIALAIFISARATPKVENNAEAYFNRGVDLQKKGDYDRAIANYSKAIEINPRLAEVYTNRGFAYLLKGQYDKAIADSNKAIELNPRLATAYSTRGNAYQGKGQYDQAIADYDKVTTRSA
jgi:tetratricopeptide (TPR) repeat protein